MLFLLVILTKQRGKKNPFYLLNMNKEQLNAGGFVPPSKDEDCVLPQKKEKILSAFIIFLFPPLKTVCVMKQLAVIFIISKGTPV